jgi:hypothetical protein
MIARITEFEQERLVLPALAVAIKGPFFYHIPAFPKRLAFGPQSAIKYCF